MLRREKEEGEEGRGGYSARVSGSLAIFARAEYPRLVWATQRRVKPFGLLLPPIG